MRVIHGVWAHGALCLWAEDPDLPQVPGAASHGVPRHDVHLPRPHPFACQAAELADMLAGRPGAAGDAARKAVHDELTLQLPSAGGGPLTYLATVARFAADLAARGRVLPVLAAEGEAYAARWRPVLGGADAQRAHDLAAAMPPSCRAAGGQAPGPLLGSALEALADAAARTRLPASLLPARRGRTPAHLPVAERYVLALTTTDARLDVVTPEDEVFWGEAAELAGRGGPPGRGGRRRLAGRPAVRPGRPAAAADGDARGLLRPAAPVPGTRAFLAVLPG